MIPFDFPVTWQKFKFAATHTSYVFYSMNYASAYIKMVTAVPKLYIQ